MVEPDGLSPTNRQLDHSAGRLSTLDMLCSNAEQKEELVQYRTTCRGIHGGMSRGIRTKLGEAKDGFKGRASQLPLRRFSRRHNDPSFLSALSHYRAYRESSGVAPMAWRPSREEKA